MYDCPRCNGVGTLRYNLYYDVFSCLACGVAMIEDVASDDPIVVDYLQQGDSVVAITEYIVPFADTQEGELDYNILEKLRDNHIATADRVPDGTTRTRKSRKNSTSGSGTDQEGSRLH